MGFLLFNLCFHVVQVPNCMIASTIAHACEKNPSLDHRRNFAIHYQKKTCFATSVAIQFLSCIGHLQLIVYIVQLIRTQLQLCCNNSFPTTMQFPYDYNHNVTLMSFFIHPSNFNIIMKIFCDFFGILISIIHYDYLFQMVLDYDMWHNQKLPRVILIEIWKYIYIYIYKQVGTYPQVGKLIQLQPTQLPTYLLNYLLII